jgi:hypothetical protein
MRTAALPFALLATTALGLRGWRRRRRGGGAGEMREIGVALASAGLPADFEEAAAEGYERLVAQKDNADASIDDVVRLALRENRDSSETREAMR